MKPPIFIVGAPRSGTTLLSKILNEHSDIHITIETHFFEEVLPQLNPRATKPTEVAETLINVHKSHLSSSQKGPELEGIFQDELVHRLNRAEQTPSAILNTYLKYHAEIRGKTRIGEKTPRHAFHLGQIRTMYPESPVLLCARDGRDFLASYKAKHRNSPEGNESKDIYHPVITSMLWRGSVQSMLQFTENDRLNHLINYENLIENPSQIIHELCDFLNVSFEKNMLTPNSSNTSYEDPNKKKGIYSSSVGKWRNRLDESEVAVFEYLNRRLLEKLGYSGASIEHPLRLGIVHFMSLPIKLPTVIWRNRDNIPMSPRYFLKRIKKMFH
ncbi:MAG: sulfotransferase [bacterium]